MRRGTPIIRRLGAAAAIATGAIATAGLGLADSAHAQTPSTTSTTTTTTTTTTSASTSTTGPPSANSTIGGYTAAVQSLGLQFGFNIPGVLPLPNENIIEADIPFARTSVQNGPLVNSLGAPYYPGDVAANLGGLIAEFAPGAPPVPDDPLLAESDYPPTPGHGADESFGVTPPAGSPIAPNVFSATSHADAAGGSVTATLVDLQASAPSSTSSTPLNVGLAPGSGPGSALQALGAVAGPALDVGSIQATSDVNIGQSEVTGTATDVLKAIDIAGVLDISQITSSAGSTSDGNKGTPAASLHMAGVTVDGEQAYIDNQGIHVSGTSTSSTGVTPQEAQSALNATFAQDGISVRLLDPQTTTNAAEGVANSGGLAVSISHSFDVPYIPGEPTIPIPELGNEGLPAGLYTATTSITLGLATSDVQATAIEPASGSGAGAGLSVGLPGGSGIGLGIGLGIGSLGGSDLGLPSTSFGPLPAGAQPSTSAGGSSPQALGSRASSRLPLGIPVPVGWLILALVLCVVMTYPMLLAARWQFLSGRGR
jgi:hypothetical protein